ncbi:hypothetical protein DFJ77DRAFT_438302 [Powellomyces hirtus]|nr:hypothetical protein DFJ77DRAFT_438302 [Powellomyces hirtus]
MESVAIPSTEPALPVASGGVGDAVVAAPVLPAPSDAGGGAPGDRPGSPPAGARKPEMTAVVPQSDGDGGAAAGLSGPSADADAAVEKGKGKSVEGLSEKKAAAAGSKSTEALNDKKGPAGGKSTEALSDKKGAAGGKSTDALNLKKGAAGSKSTEALNDKKSSKSNDALKGAGGGSINTLSTTKPPGSVSALAQSASPATNATPGSAVTKSTEVLQKQTAPTTTGEAHNVTISSAPTADGGIALAATAVVDGKEVAFAAVEEPVKEDNTYINGAGGVNTPLFKGEKAIDALPLLAWPGRRAVHDCRQRVIDGQGGFACVTRDHQTREGSAVKDGNMIHIGIMKGDGVPSFQQRTKEGYKPNGYR